MFLSFAVSCCLFLIPKSGLTEYVKICLHLFAGSFEHFGDLWVHNPWMVDGAGRAWPGEGKRAALLYSGDELGNRLGNRLGHRAYRTDTSRQIKSCLQSSRVLGWPLIVVQDTSAVSGTWPGSFQPRLLPRLQGRAAGVRQPADGGRHAGPRIKPLPLY